MELEKIPLIKLSDMLNDAYLKQDQCMTNLLAGEVARRLYVPNPSITFENFRAQFGYKPIGEEKQKMMVKRIELYEE